MEGVRPEAAVADEPGMVLVRAPRPWVAGIDGGGTRTRCWVASLDGTLLGRGESGPSNYMVVGAEAAARALDEALRAALTEARVRARTETGLSGGVRESQAASATPSGGAPGTATGAPLAETPTAICLGMAGADRPDDQRVLTEALAARGWQGWPLHWVNDAAIVLAAGRTEGAVAALIAGTGSIVYAQAETGADGESGPAVRVGGWGPILGDEGSGYDLGRRALVAVLRAADGRGPQTALTEKILAELGLSSPFALPPLVYRGGLDRPRIAALSRIVVACAQAGDEVALGLVRSGAAALAELVITALRRLGRLDEPGVKVVVAGGLFADGSPMWEWVRQALAELCPQASIRLIPLPVEPAVGAVLLALTRNSLARMSPSQAWDLPGSGLFVRLRQSYEAWGTSASQL
ncbi:MAG: hypothetical protein IMX00_00275 [Limnochordales bacterium]|nr:hypothetical protein [Limnochordales bacterium]